MRPRIVSGLLLCLLALVPAAACVAQNGPTAPAAATLLFETYLQNLPTVSGLQASAGTPLVAWARQIAGRRSIWIADGAVLQPRPLLEYPADDGLPLSLLTLSANGKYLAYVRGGWPNRQGEINNPLDAPDPAERVLWVMDTGGAQPLRVAGGAVGIHALSMAPDSATLAYAQGSDVWLASLPDGAARRALRIRGSVGALSWSPDGRRLAFVSSRGTHSFVGVFDVGARIVRYLAPAIDRDFNPVWSPDGKWLAFLRTREEVQVYRFTPRRTGIPWSIMLADTTTWSVRTLWTADAGDGSVFSPLVLDVSSGMGPTSNWSSLLWTAGNRLVFPWEKTGWRQLYAIPAAGGRAVALTAGAGEVATAVASPDGRTLVYQANTAVRERYEVLRIAATGGPPEVLWNKGAPYGDPAAVLADGRAVFFGGTGRTPEQVMVSSDGPARALLSAAVPADFPAAAMAEPVAVIFTADDGFVAHGLLFRPQQKSTAPRAALVWAHGGPDDLTSPGVSKYDSRWIQSAVLSGYIVLAVNYRAGRGYGLAYRAAPGQGGGGGSDALDVIAAGRYLATLPDVDARRVGVFGQSYGGYLATAALARAPQMWAAGVSIVGVADWQMEMELDDGKPLPMRITQRAQYEDTAFNSSANVNLDGWRAPILFVSADDDQSGWLAQAVQLGQSLRRRGVDVEAFVEPGGTHGGVTHRQVVERVRHVLDFFDRHLLGRDAEDFRR